MALSQKDESILEQIVAVEGDCLEEPRCKECPFRGICLPEFLYIPMTKNQRMSMALDVLAHHALFPNPKKDSVDEYRENQ